MTRFVRNFALLTALVALISSPALAGEKAADLKEGDKAPQFEAKDDQGETFKSADLLGKKILVVYFYPAAMTGGCTKQACAFRDDMKKLSGEDVVVVGVSGDEVPNLALFKKAEDLNFPLLSDYDGKVAKAFGVPTRDGGEIKRTVDGEEHTLKRGVTTARWTFVIDKDGKIVLKNTKVDAPQDSATVLKTVEKLKKS